MVQRGGTLAKACFPGWRRCRRPRIIRLPFLLGGRWGGIGNAPSAGAYSRGVWWVGALLARRLRGHEEPWQGRTLVGCGGWSARFWYRGEVATVGLEGMKNRGRGVLYRDVVVGPHAFGTAALAWKGRHFRILEWSGGWSTSTSTSRLPHTHAHTHTHTRTHAHKHMPTYTQTRRHTYTDVLKSLVFCVFLTIQCIKEKHRHVGLSGAVT